MALEIVANDFTTMMPESLCVVLQKRWMVPAKANVYKWSVDYENDSVKKWIERWENVCQYQYHRS